MNEKGIFGFYIIILSKLCYFCIINLDYAIILKSCIILCYLAISLFKYIKCKLDVDFLKEKN